MGHEISVRQGSPMTDERLAELLAEVNRLRAELELAITALADIGHARDLDEKSAKSKARRVYGELRGRNP